MFVKTLLTVAVIVAVAGCQSTATKPVANAGETPIEVEGVVEIYSGGHGLGFVKLDNGKCYDLALPRDTLKNSLRWYKKRARISGSLQFRPRMDDMMWFDIKDRKIEGFGCSEDVIYVETIKKL